MSYQLGSDPDELDNLARRCDQSAGSFTSARTAVNAQLGGVFWEGPDATRFHESWESATSQLLQRAAESLGRAAEDLRTQARQQRDVSQS